MTVLFKKLLESQPVAINIGVRGFGESLVTQGIEVLFVEWAPPAGGDHELLGLLDQLL